MSAVCATSRRERDADGRWPTNGTDEGPRFWSRSRVSGWFVGVRLVKCNHETCNATVGHGCGNDDAGDRGAGDDNPDNLGSGADNRGTGAGNRGAGDHEAGDYEAGNEEDADWRRCLVLI